MDKKEKIKNDSRNQSAMDFIKDIVENSEPMPIEFSRIVDEHFDELI